MWREKLKGNSNISTLRNTGAGALGHLGEIERLREGIVRWALGAEIFIRKLSESSSSFKWNKTNTSLCILSFEAKDRATLLYVK